MGTKKVYEARINELKEFAIEDDILIKPGLEKKMLEFLENPPIKHRPFITLTDSGCYHLMWNIKGGGKLHVEFRENNTAKVGIYRTSPHLRYVSGVVHIDKIYDLIDIFRNLESL